MRGSFARILIVLLLMAGVANIRPATAQLGLAAGLNFDDLRDVDVGNAEATFDNASGYHIGLFYDLGFGPVNFRFGLFYRDLGRIRAEVERITSDAFDVSLIEVPVDLRINVLSTPILSPYLTIGPVFSFPRSSDSRFRDNLENMAVSANVGAGLAINLAGIRLFPEFRYNVGVSRFLKEQVEIGGISFVAADAQRLNSIMLRLGIGL